MLANPLLRKGSAADCGALHAPTVLACESRQAAMLELGTVPAALIPAAVSDVNFERGAARQCRHRCMVRYQQYAMMKLFAELQKMLPTSLFHLSILIHHCRYASKLLCQQV